MFVTGKSCYRQSPQLSGRGVEYNPSTLKPRVTPLILDVCVRLCVCDHVCVFVAVFRARLPKGHVQDVSLGPSGWPLSGLYHHLPAVVLHVKRF